MEVEHEECVAGRVAADAIGVADVYAWPAGDLSRPMTGGALRSLSGPPTGPMFAKQHMAGALPCPAPKRGCPGNQGLEGLPGHPAICDRCNPYNRHQPDRI